MTAHSPARPKGTHPEKQFRRIFPHFSHIFPALLFSLISSGTFGGMVALFVSANLPFRTILPYPNQQGTLAATSVQFATEPPHSTSFVLAAVNPAHLGSETAQPNTRDGLRSDSDFPENSGVSDRIHELESVIMEYPDYRDGYLELASLYRLRGDEVSAQRMIDQASVLDPLITQVMPHLFSR